MKSFVLVAVALLVSTGAAAAAYSMKDLNALAKSQSWNELLGHGLDIGPADRDEAWQGVIEKAAAGRLAELKDEDLKYLSSTKSMIESDEKTFTFLKTSKSYRRAADKAMIKTFKGCYQSRECKDGNDVDWIISVNKYLEKDAGKDPVAACEAGDMITSFMTGTSGLIAYEMAVASRTECCKSKAMKEAVTASQKEKDYKAQADKIAAKCKF